MKNEKLKYDIDLLQVYKAQKAYVQKAEKSGDTDTLYYRCLQNNVIKAERLMEKIREIQKPAYAGMTEAVYVEREKQQKVAEMYGISVRTLQRECNKILWEATNAIQKQQH